MKTHALHDRVREVNENFLTRCSPKLKVAPSVPAFRPCKLVERVPINDMRFLLGPALSQQPRNAMRRLQPAGPLWTFWDYKYERWAKDKGMRLDRLLLSPKVSDRLVDGGVDRGAPGQLNASDHAPTRISLNL